MINFNPTKNGKMIACLFPETESERSGMIKELKSRGFSRKGTVHEDMRMTATIDGVIHTAVIEWVED